MRREDRGAIERGDGGRRPRKGIERRGRKGRDAAARLRRKTRRATRPSRPPEIENGGLKTRRGAVVGVVGRKVFLAKLGGLVTTGLAAIEAGFSCAQEQGAEGWKDKRKAEKSQATGAAVPVEGVVEGVLGKDNKREWARERGSWTARGMGDGEEEDGEERQKHLGAVLCNGLRHRMDGDVLVRTPTYPDGTHSSQRPREWPGSLGPCQQPAASGQQRAASQRALALNPTANGRWGRLGRLSLRWWCLRPPATQPAGPGKHWLPLQARRS